MMQKILVVIMIVVHCIQGAVIKESKDVSVNKLPISQNDTLEESNKTNKSTSGHDNRPMLVSLSKSLGADTNILNRSAQNSSATAKFPDITTDSIVKENKYIEVNNKTVEKQHNTSSDKSKPINETNTQKIRIDKNPEYMNNDIVTIEINNIDDIPEMFEDEEFLEKNGTSESIKSPETQNDDAFLQSIMENKNSTEKEVIMEEHPVGTFTKNFELLDLDDNIQKGNVTIPAIGHIDDDFEEGSIPIISDLRAGHNPDGTIDEVFLSFVTAIHKYEVEQEAKENKRLQQKVEIDEEDFNDSNKNQEVNDKQTNQEVEEKTEPNFRIENKIVQNVNKEDDEGIYDKIENQSGKENDQIEIKKNKKLKEKKLNQVIPEKEKVIPRHSKSEEKLEGQSNLENARLIGNILKLIENKTNATIVNADINNQELKEIESYDVTKDLEDGEGNKETIEGN